MLLRKTGLLKICLLVGLQIARGQQYESDYSFEDGDADDRAGASEDDTKTDYSKYYSVEGAAPLIQPGNQETTGFVNPADFYSFFSSPEFGASNTKQASIAPPKNPFAAPTDTIQGFVDPKADFLLFQSSSPRDYFEQAQRKEQLKQQAKEDEESPFETKPGPSYVSHKLPAKYASTNDKPVSTKPANNLKKQYEQISAKDTAQEDNYKVPDYAFDFPSGKLANYNVGKSSSTVSQYPALAATLASKQTAKPILPTLTPYQKFSFQPVPETSNYQPKYLESLLSTAAPFNPNYAKLAPKTIEGQATENRPANLNNCAKITKEVPQKDIASGKIVAQKMDCYVCEDPKTSSKHTQCAYNSEPASEQFFTGESERYSIPAKAPSGFRYKRFSGDEDDPFESIQERLGLTGFRYKRFSGDETDPYEYVRSKSLAAFKEATRPDQDEEAYNYKPEYYSDSYDKSSSELHSEQLQKNPGNCEKVVKDKMTCTICKDPKTGGNYEQCSYTSAPTEKKYAYVTEQKYDSLEDKPEETRTITKTSGGDSPAKASKKISEVIGAHSQDSKTAAKPVKESSKPYRGSSKPIKDYSKPTDIDFSKSASTTIKDYSKPTDKDFIKTVAAASKKSTKYAEPVEDYKGKRPQLKRPERAYGENERRGEESREKGTGYNYKPGDKYKIEEELGKDIEDPYGYDIHKEFESESRKQSNLVDSDGKDPDDKKSADEDPYAFPKYFAESTKQEPRASGLDPKLFGSADSSEATAEGDTDSDTESTDQKISNFEKEIEEYHRKLFPDYDKQESRREDKREEKETDGYEPYKYKDYSKENIQEETQEVEQVLAEFVKKDRSNCKQARKKGMTCYLCVDDKGMQHEECMYVSESKPRPTHIAYHEIEKVKIPNQASEESKNKPVVAPTLPTITKPVSIKVAASEVKPLTATADSKIIKPVELVAAASNGYESKVKYEKPSKNKKSKKYNKEREEKKDREPFVSSSNDDPERLPEDDPDKLSDDGVPTQETPVEFQVAETEGAFSEETKPVYSKALGVTLPRYMLEKSEFEKEFDSFSGDS